MRLDTGRAVRLLETMQVPGFGSPVAFAADGSRLAYQVGTKVLVSSPDGRQLSSFALPPDTALAGKGAWLPDGSLALVAHEAAGDRWRLRRVDTDGRELPAPALAAVEGVTAIRLLGWLPDGTAWVVAYRPEPSGRAGTPTAWRWTSGPRTATCDRSGC